MLGWSINLFRVFGIRLAVHFSFLLLLAYVAWEGWMEAGWAGVACGVVFLILAPFIKHWAHGADATTADPG